MDTTAIGKTMIAKEPISSAKRMYIDVVDSINNMNANFHAGAPRLPLHMPLSNGSSIGSILYALNSVIKMEDKLCARLRKRSNFKPVNTLANFRYKSSVDSVAIRTEEKPPKNLAAIFQRALEDIIVSESVRDQDQPSKAQAIAIAAIKEIG